MAEQKNTELPRPKPNYFISILSISLVLLLVGLVSFMFWHTNRLLDSFKESINVIVELRDSSDTNALAQLTTYLQSNDKIKEGSIDFVDKEKALSLMKQEMGDDFLLDEMANPLFDVVVFNMKAAFMNTSDLEEIKKYLTEKYDIISNVYYQQTFVDKASGSLSKIGWILIGLSILFLIIAITIMHSTIKLAMYSHRFLIKNMELVGASRNFIRKPFMARGLMSGLISGIIAVCALLGIIYLINMYVPDFKEILDWNNTIILFIALIVGGIIVTLVSTFFITNKYLRLRKEELF